MSNVTIEVTDSLIGRFAHLRTLGLTWAYRVIAGQEEVIGGTTNQRDAWREARAMKKRLEKIQAGKLATAYGRVEHVG